MPLEAAGSLRKLLEAAAAARSNTFAVVVCGMRFSLPICACVRVSFKVTESFSNGAGNAVCSERGKSARDGLLVSYNPTRAWRTCARTPADSGTPRNVTRPQVADRGPHGC